MSERLSGKSGERESLPRDEFSPMEKRMDMLEKMHLNETVQYFTGEILKEYGYIDEMAQELVASDSEDVAELMNVVEEILAEFGDGIVPQTSDSNEAYLVFNLEKVMLGLAQGDGVVFTETIRGRDYSYYIREVNDLLGEIGASKPKKGGKEEDEVVSEPKMLHSREDLYESEVFDELAEKYPILTEAGEFSNLYQGDSNKEVVNYMREGLRIIRDLEPYLSDVEHEGESLFQSMDEANTLMDEFLYSYDSNGSMDFDELVGYAEAFEDAGRRVGKLALYWRFRKDGGNIEELNESAKIQASFLAYTQFTNLLQRTAFNSLVIANKPK